MQLTTSDVFKLSTIRGTPFPNSLLELAMTLPQTQARLLLLIVRQTVGFSAGPGLRRASSRMSHAQISKRIGRSSTAITDAISALVARGVVETIDGSGNLLQTAAQRRLLRGPLTFRLSSSLVDVGVEKAVEDHG